MNPHDPLDIDVSYHVLHEVLRVETRFNQVDTTHKPLLCGFSLLQTDVPSGFELGQQFPDGDFVDFSHLFVQGIKDGFNVVDLFFLEVLDLRQFLYLLGLHTDIVNLDTKIG